MLTSYSIIEVLARSFTIHVKLQTFNYNLDIELFSWLF